VNIGRLIHWRHKLFWRHYLLWSHRIDLFLVFVVCYLLAGILFACVYVYSVKSKEAEIDDLLSRYTENRSSLLAVLDVARTEPLGEDHNHTLGKIEFLNASYPSMTDFSTKPATYRLKQEINEEVRKALSAFKFDNLSSMATKTVGDLIVFKAYFVYYLSSSYVYLGQTVASYGLLLVLIPAILMAFFVANVFYTKSMSAMKDQPTFLLVLLPLIILVALPLSIATITQVAGNRTIPGIVERSAILSKEFFVPGYEFSVQTYYYNVDEEFDAHALRALIRGNEEFRRVNLGRANGLVSADEYSVTPVAGMFLATVLWLAAGVWIVRRFGWELFLVCSTVGLAIIVGAAFTTETFFGGLGSSDRRLFSSELHLFRMSVKAPESVLVAAIIVFIVVFVIGLFFDWYREYFLCTGYLGVLVSAYAIIVSPIVVDRANVTMALALVVAIIGLIAVIEIVLRRWMVKALNDPR
jgi:hypothetical protein